LDFGLDARVTSREPGRMLLQVTPGHTGVWMQLSATNIANPLRNIRIIMPGFEKSYEEEPFHPLFIDSLSKFKTIRFMNWQILPQRHNDDAVVEWDDLPSPHLFQSKNNGVHPEWMIKLANKLKADPWFNLPHKVSNDFITQFAMFVKEYLDPDLKAYVEYSNEVWNSLYPQYGYARDEGLRLQLSQESRQASLRYYSQKSVEIFKIWKNVLGPDRVVGVLASQSTQPALGLEVMSWKEAYLSADVYATAPYISGAGGSSTIEVLDNLEKDIERMMLNERQNALNAHSFGLKHVAYEGGQHLTSPDQQEQSIFLEVNQHPEIKDIYLKYLNQWFEVGDGPFVHFSYVSAPSQYGSWGALEYQDQRREEAPKYDALLTFIESR
jgi:hypothetical protein